MVSKREITPAITNLVRAGIAALDAGRGIRDPPSYNRWNMRLEWVVIGTDLWDQYCTGIPAPWRYRGPGYGPEVDDLDRVWDVLDEVTEKLEIDFDTNDGRVKGESVRLERIVEPVQYKSGRATRSGRYAVSALMNDLDTVRADLDRGRVEFEEHMAAWKQRMITRRLYRSPRSAPQCGCAAKRTTAQRMK